jgi:hypothetical protein
MTSLSTSHGAGPSHASRVGALRLPQRMPCGSTPSWAARPDKELASCSARYPDGGFSFEVSRDLPAYRLSQLSRQAQLLVVGSRGRDEFPSLFLGSVSHALLRKADCPAAIVRPDPPGWS